MLNKLTYLLTYDKQLGGEGNTAIDVRGGGSTNGEVQGAKAPQLPRFELFIVLRIVRFRNSPCSSDIAEMLATLHSSAAVRC